MGGSCLKSLKLPESSQQSPFTEKAREGHVVVANKVLSVSSFFIEVRSWSGNDNPVNLYRMNVILCLDKKGKSHKAKLSPSKVPIEAKRWQISVHSSFEVRFPHLPSCHP